MSKGEIGVYRRHRPGIARYLAAAGELTEVPGSLAASRPAPLEQPGP